MSPRRPGFSLVEVLLALAIMVMSLAAIGYLVGFGSERAMEARYRARGDRLAQAKMAEVEAGVVSVQSGGQGTCDDDPAWTWSVEPQSAGLPNLYLVTVKVSRPLRGKSFEVTLSQMIFDPTVQGSPAQAETPSDTDLSTAETNTATAESGGTTTGTGGTSP